MLLCNEIALNAIKLQFHRPVFRMALKANSYFAIEFSKFFRVKFNILNISNLLVDEQMTVHLLDKNNYCENITQRCCGMLTHLFYEKRVIDWPGPIYLN